MSAEDIIAKIDVLRSKDFVPVEYKDDWRHFSPRQSLMINGQKVKCNEDLIRNLNHVMVKKQLTSNRWYPRSCLKALHLKPRVKGTRGIQIINRFTDKVESFLNADQLISTETPKRKKARNVTIALCNKRIDNVIDSMHVEVVEGDISPAYYDVYDRIAIPRRTRFTSVDEFYKILLHEVGHWTAYRMGREASATSELDAEYYKEELVAEMTSMFLSDFFDLKIDFDQCIAYLHGYLNALVSEFFGQESVDDLLDDAIGKALIASDYVMKFDKSS